MIISLVAKIEELKARFRVSYRLVLANLPFCPATYRRWKNRVCRGEKPVQKPGPKPMKPLNLEVLAGQLTHLDHRRKRSFGVEKLRVATKGAISKRDLDELIANARKHELRQRKARQSRLSWLKPGSVWGMDTFETALPNIAGKCYVLAVQDLASGYKLPLLTAKKEPEGCQVAHHLEQLFSRFGRPLFIKRDNGGNLNQSKVNELFADHCVIPLNNPCYYAQYNGAIEHAQGELKRLLEKEYYNIRSFSEFERCVDLAAHDLNHAARRYLGGVTSCIKFFQKPAINYSKKSRKEVFLWICDYASDIVEKAGSSLSLTTAWRIACKFWLVQNGLLAISKSAIVLPYYSDSFAHN